LRARAAARGFAASLPTVTMCGRYVAPDEAAIEREFHLVRTAWQFPESYNVAPSQEVPVVRQEDGAACGRLLRFGLIPYFAAGLAPRYSTINARLETLRTSACYRGPWARGQRCLVPARGFYEWQTQPDGRKVPYYLRTVDQEIFGFAALWDRSRRADGTVIDSFALITMPANALLARIHNGRQRMPAILRREMRTAWLSGSAEDAWAALLPYPEERMEAWTVSTRVNKPANNDPELIAPLAAA
jgi:putative SOS response-associated peptidase YedK